MKVYFAFLYGIFSCFFLRQFFFIFFAPFFLHFLCGSFSLRHFLLLYFTAVCPSGSFSFFSFTAVFPYSNFCSFSLRQFILLFFTAVFLFFYGSFSCCILRQFFLTAVFLALLYGSFPLCHFFFAFLYGSYSCFYVLHFLTTFFFFFFCLYFLSISFSGFHLLEQSFSYFSLRFLWEYMYTENLGLTARLTTHNWPW